MPCANVGGNEKIADRMKNVFECLVAKLYRGLDFAPHQIGLRQMLAAILITGINCQALLQRRYRLIEKTGKRIMHTLPQPRRRIFGVFLNCNAKIIKGADHVMIDIRRH